MCYEVTEIRVNLVCISVQKLSAGMLIQFTQYFDVKIVMETNLPDCDQEMG